MNDKTTPISTVAVDPLVSCDYEGMTERDWVDYEFATIVYDCRLPEEVVSRIESLFDRLCSVNN